MLYPDTYTHLNASPISIHQVCQLRERGATSAPPSLKLGNYPSSLVDAKEWTYKGNLGTGDFHLTIDPQHLVLLQANNFVVYDHASRIDTYFAAQYVVPITWATKNQYCGAAPNRVSIAHWTATRMQDYPWSYTLDTHNERNRVTLHVLKTGKVYVVRYPQGKEILHPNEVESHLCTLLLDRRIRTERHWGAALSTPHRICTAGEAIEAEINRYDAEF